MNASIECVWEMHRRKTNEKMLILTPQISKSRLRRLLRTACGQAAGGRGPFPFLMHPLANRPSRPGGTELNDVDSELKKKLLELQQIYDSGLISEDEFKKKRIDLLGKIFGRIFFEYSYSNHL